MAGEQDLDALIRGMQPELGPEVYGFVALPAGRAVPGGLSPLMSFAELEGLTLIVPLAEARAAGLKAEFPCRAITLRVHSALSAVGFLAAVTGRLAAAGISVNAVSGFFHDHLFVPEAEAGEALAELLRMARARD